MAINVDDRFVVTPLRLKRLLLRSMMKYDSVFIWGAPGIGKTDIVRALSKELKARLVAIHLPQYDPVDLKGVPVRIDDDVKWVPTSYLPQQKRFKVRNKIGEFIAGYSFPYEETTTVTVLDTDGNVVARLNGIFGDVPNENISLGWEPGKATVIFGTEFTGTIVVEERAILFLDELSAAPPAVQNAALNLCLDRRVGEYDVPMTTPILAAGNRAADNAYVHQMSFPLMGRFIHFILEPSVEDWTTDWAPNHGTNPAIVAFIRMGSADPTERLAIMYPEPEIAAGYNGVATPRTWARFSKYVDDFDNKEIDSDDLACYGVGNVGRGMTAMFMEFIEHISKLPDVDDFLLRGKTPPKLESLSLSQRWGMAVALAARLKKHYDRLNVKNRGYKDIDPEWTSIFENFTIVVTTSFSPEIMAFALLMCFRSYNIMPYISNDSVILRDFADEYADFIGRAMPPR